MAFAKKCYLGAIQAEDKSAERLTMDKLANLVRWAECHPSDYFEHRPIQFALNMYHVTAAWDTITGLFEEADDDEIAAVVEEFNEGLRSVCGLRGAEYEFDKLSFAA